MPGTEARTDCKSASAVARGSTTSGAQQLVRDPRHGADDDDWAVALRNASGNDGRGALDGDWVLDRRAAKLHDYQTHANLSNG
jgi:hypothetical protein